MSKQLPIRSNTENTHKSSRGVGRDCQVCCTFRQDTIIVRGNNSFKSPYSPCAFLQSYSQMFRHPTSLVGVLTASFEIFTKKPVLCKKHFWTRNASICESGGKWGQGWGRATNQEQVHCSSIGSREGCLQKFSALIAR